MNKITDRSQNDSRIRVKVSHLISRFDIGAHLIGESLINLRIMKNTVPQFGLPHELAHIQQRKRDIVPADAHGFGTDIHAGAHDGVEHVLRLVIVQQRADIDAQADGCP